MKVIKYPYFYKNQRKAILKDKTMHEYSYLIKICVFADKEVGKKTLAKSDFLSSFFDEVDYMSTIGVEFTLKTINYQEGISLQLWIISEKENPPSVWKMFIHGSLSLIFMYDITNAESLDWLSKCCKMVHNDREEIPILLVGNKLDLEENREITNEQVEKFKRDNKVVSSMKISLKTGKNVEEMFLKISSMALNISLKELKAGINRKDREKLREIHGTFMRDIDRIIWIHNKNLTGKRNLKKLKRLWKKTPFSKTSFFEEYVANQRKLILRLTECKNEIVNAKEIAEVMKVWEKVKDLSEKLNFLLKYNK